MLNETYKAILLSKGYVYYDDEELWETLKKKDFEPVFTAA